MAVAVSRRQPSPTKLTQFHENGDDRIFPPSVIIFFTVMVPGGGIAFYGCRWLPRHSAAGSACLVLIKPGPASPPPAHATKVSLSVTHSESLHTHASHATRPGGAVALIARVWGRRLALCSPLSREGRNAIRARECKMDVKASFLQPIYPGI